MSNSQKTSQFSKLTSLNDASDITLIDNGQNFTISYADFKTGLGVTGTLTSVGDPLGEPVLNNPSPNEYEIRTIESGAGVIASASPENGITLNWNVDQDTAGLPITSGLTSPKPVLSSLIPGVGIDIAKVGDEITITATGEVTTPSINVISQESDFAVQDATTITLEEGVTYVLGVSLATTKRFICETGASLTALNKFGVVLTYTGAGNMFSGEDANFNIFQISIDAPNGAQYFSFEDVAVLNTNIFWCADVIGLTCGKFGSLTSLASFVIVDTAITGDCTDGLSIFGANWRVWRIQNSGFITTSTTFTGIDLGTATVGACTIGPLVFVGQGGVGAVGISGMANSGNILTGNVARITETNYLGNVTPKTGIEDDAVRWQFTDNSQIPDSISDALISIESNVTETVITSSNTPVKIAGTFITEGVSRFAHDGTGRATFTGERSEKLPIDFSATILAASGSDKQITVYFAINGVVVSQTGKQGTASSTKAAAITVIWQHDFQTNDYIEAWVENNTDTINVVCQQAVERVN